MKTIPNTLDSIFMIILSILFLFNIYPALALLPFTVLPLQLFIFIRYLKKAHQINSQIRDSQSNLSMNVQENINGVRIVRSFAAENYEKKKFDKSSSLFKNMYFKQADFVTKYGFGFNFLRHSLYMISIAAGSVLAIQGKIGIGAFLAFITYVFTILDATTNIINYMFEFQLYLVSGERIMTFIETGNIIDNSDNPKTITFPPNIKVENINLTIDGQIILKNVCINIPYGKKLGIMGNTSSGKTSLLKILSRFVDPVYGSIIINGINLKDIELEQVRKIYSYVMQDVFLFSNTVDSNIALYDMDMPFEKVENCAKLSEANDFIIKMQDGYDTVIGERGIGLSGGQKQRISIARALAKDAPVLLLDDVTSALDTETEKTLLKNIYTNYPEKTVIITAHRATSVKDCDEIIYLNNGEIAERGTHKELLELNGRYAKIYKEQSSKNIGE